MSACRKTNLDNLQRANAIRRARFRLHVELAGATMVDALLHLAEVLDNPPQDLWSLEIGEALGWIPRWGYVRANEFLRQYALRPTIALALNGPVNTKHDRGMTPRERAVIATALRRIADERTWR